MGDDGESYVLYTTDDGEWVIVGDCSQVAMSAKAGGKSIERMLKPRRVLRFSDEFYREIGVLERKRAYALARSRRNNETVKRCAHGRTQRTRRKR